MISHGYLLKSDGADYDYLQFTKNGGREVDFNFYHVSHDLNTVYSEWFIPNSFFTKLLGTLSNAKSYKGRWKSLIKPLNFTSPLIYQAVLFLKKKGIFYKSAGYTTPVNLMKEFKFIEISKISVRVPSLHDAILEYIYGPDWRIPRKQYDWVTESPSTRISKARFK